MTKYIPHHQGVLVPEANREKIRSMIDRIGEAATVRLLEVTRLTMTRAIAGLGVHKGTSLHLASRLASEEVAAALTEIPR